MNCFTRLVLVRFADYMIFEKENSLPTTSRHISLGLQYLICIFCFNICLEFNGVLGSSSSRIIVFCEIGPKL